MLSWYYMLSTLEVTASWACRGSLCPLLDIKVNISIMVYNLISDREDGYSVGGVTITVSFLSMCNIFSCHCYEVNKKLQSLLHPELSVKEEYLTYISVLLSSSREQSLQWGKLGHNNGKFTHVHEQIFNIIHIIYMIACKHAKIFMTNAKTLFYIWCDLSLLK